MKTPARQTSYNALVEALNQQAMSDFELGEKMKAASRIQDIEEGYRLLALPDDQLAMFGWTRQDLVIAVDAKKGKGNAPFYLHTAHERHNTRLRVVADLAAGGNGAGTARGYVLPTSAAPRLAVMDAEPEDEP